MKITKLEARFLRVPLKRPVSLPTSQDPKATSHVDVVVVELHAGSSVGLGYCTSFGGGGAILKLLKDVVMPAVLDHDARRTEWLFEQTAAQLAGVGFTGIAASAYAAVDIALWDWKGKEANSPLWQLLGGYRTAVKPITVDVATPVLGVKQSGKECTAALDSGSAGIQIEVGTMDPDLDYERLKQLRDVIPDGAWFEINCGGRYDFATAIWLATVGTEELGLDGFADPLAPGDANYSRLVDRVDVGISAGAHSDSRVSLHAALQRGGLEALRLDPFRLGGITPVRKLIHAAELQQVSFTTVRCPELGVHLGCGSLLGRMCEHVDWLGELFVEPLHMKNGQLYAPSAAGLGLTLHEVNAGKWLVA